MLGLDDLKGIFQPKQFYDSTTILLSQGCPGFSSLTARQPHQQYHGSAAAFVSEVSSSITAALHWALQDLRGENLYVRRDKKSHSFSSSFHSMSHFLQYLQHNVRVMPNKNIFAYINSFPVTHSLHLLLLFPFSLDYSKQRLLIYSSRAESQLLFAQLPCKSVFAKAQMASLLLPCLYISMHFVIQGKKLPD